MAITYDDKEFRQLLRDMNVKQRLKTFRGIFAREATKVRKVAVNNLRSSGINTDTGLDKGIRRSVFKRKVGFKVSVAARAASKKGKGEYGMHKNRKGLKKPILVWAEQGTEKRRTKTKTKIFTRSRKGHNTGRMKRYGFMRQTLADVKDTVTTSVHNEVIKTFKRIAKKNGCK